MTDHPPPVRHALVVDDDLDLAQLCALLLGRLGFQVVRASGAEEVLDRDEAFLDGIDLLLTDLQMPGAGGDALATELRRRYPTLAIVVTSGYAGATPDAGRTEFLRKPFTLRELADTVDRAFDQAGAPARGRHGGPRTEENR